MDKTPLSGHLPDGVVDFGGIFVFQSFLAPGADHPDAVYRFDEKVLAADHLLKFGGIGLFYRPVVLRHLAPSRFRLAPAISVFGLKTRCRADTLGSHQVGWDVNQPAERFKFEMTTFELIAAKLIALAKLKSLRQHL